MNELTKLFKFAIVGVTNTSLDFLLFAILFYIARMELIQANSIAFIVAVTNSYILNKFWTFNDTNVKKSTFHQWGNFLLINGIGLIISNILIYISSAVLNAMTAKLVATAVVFGWSYFMSKRFVFA